MAQHFLTPILALSYAAYDRRRLMEMERRGLPVWEARREAEVQIVHGLAGLDVDSGDVAAILRAIYEIDRAARRGIHLGANRALDIAFAAAREDDLAERSTVGCEPATIYRRGEDGERVEQTLGRAFSARTPIMRRACPHGVYQPGWSRERVLAEAKTATRVPGTDRWRLAWAWIRSMRGKVYRGGPGRLLVQDQRHSSIPATCAAIEEGLVEYARAGDIFTLTAAGRAACDL